MAKEKEFKIGDKVEFSKFNGVFEIVAELNGMLVVQSSTVRAFAKPAELKLIENG
jgi:co-chaperonin GroES (HSP10)